MAAAVVALVLLAAGVTYGAVSAASRARAEAPAPIEPVSLASASTSESTGTAGMLVEIPVLTGMQLAEAELMLEAAGLGAVRTPTPAGSEPSGTVVAQIPAAGERVTPGTVIELVWADPSATQAAAPRATPGQYVVCIDPGHQAKANLATEPIGPGSATKKAKVSGGATGVVTKAPEHSVVLAIALKVAARLEAKGVKVVMTRTVADVDISNSQRAKVANDAGADLSVRIHADSSTNADLRGISTLYPADNDWVKSIENQSLEAARLVQSAVIATTGAADRGVVSRSDLTGFNFSTVPAVLVEAGFMSNPVDDRRLSDPAYQDLLADGIVAGIMAYLED